MAAPPVKEEKPQMTIHQREDSDIQLEELFQIGLNNAGAKRPLSIPMKMRNLPSSFFTPPTVGSKSPSVHSRENSLDNTGPFSPGPVASPGLGQPAGPRPTTAGPTPAPPPSDRPSPWHSSTRLTRPCSTCTTGSSPAILHEPPHQDNTVGGPQQASYTS